MAMNKSCFVIFAPKFHVFRGVLDRLGTLDTSVVFQTDSTSGTYGRINRHNQHLPGYQQQAVPGVSDWGVNTRNDNFWALTRSRSRTNPIESHRISLIKIGHNLLSNVSVSQRAFYQILEEGTRTGVVISNSNELMYVCNKRLNAELDVGFSMFRYVVTSMIAAIVALCCFGSLWPHLMHAEFTGSLLALALLAISTYLFVAGYSSGIEGRRRYYEALNDARL